MTRRPFTVAFAVTALAFVLMSDTAPAKTLAPKKITISLKAPATNYKVKITELRIVGNEVWVLASVSSSGLGGAAITTIKDSVTANTTLKTVKIFVTGKTWNWKNKANIKFIKTVADLGATWKKGSKISFTR